MKKVFSLFLIFNSVFLDALPSQKQTFGDVSLDFADHSLQVNAQGKAIIDWKQFDIALNEKVSFHQLQPNRAVLNRVIEGDASQILGVLQANCPIYLINEKGVYIGSSAQIQTAGFIASTADLANSVFLSDEMLSFENLGAGQVINLGKIRCNQGDIVLIARSIDNQGSLKASNGFVSCVTSEIMVSPGEKQAVFIRLQEPLEDEKGIVNSGRIEALSVDLRTLSPYQKAIRHSGTIDASFTHEENGKIYLVAEKGGCEIHGLISAPSGEVHIHTDSALLAEQAVIDVSAKSDPGIVCVTASRHLLQVNNGAVLATNAALEGNGGSISLVADEALSFHGFAQARGGKEGGDGGTIHLCSHGALFDMAEDHPIVDTIALNGKSGTVIFDPKFAIISSSGADPATGQTFSSDPSGTAVISGTTLQTALNAANVVIQANTDIVFEDTVTATTLGNSLTLQAGRSIELNSQLTLNSGDLIATINDSGALPADRDSGVAQFSIGSDAVIATQGGNINVGVGSFNSVQEGEISISSAAVDAGGGNISLTGFGGLNAIDYSHGISIYGSVIQTANLGTIELNGTGGNGSNINIGVYVNGLDALLQTENGQIHLIGQGGGNGSGNGNAGIFASGTIQSIGSGSVLFDGTGGDGAHFNLGAILSSGQIQTQDGNLTLNGTGSGTGAMNFGLRLELQASCEATGSGAISLSGTSANGKNNNHGVILSGGSLIANTGSITINGTGQGSINYNHGIRLEGNTQCSSTGTAPISFQGQNISGLNQNTGVSFSTDGVAITSRYGDITVNGTTDATGIQNQGIRIEKGQIVSTETDPGSANITLTGIGGIGTNYCNGIVVLGSESAVSSVDGDITLQGTARANGVGNNPILIDPPTQVFTTGTGTVTYIEN